jgi:hypothetical protein
LLIHGRSARLAPELPGSGTTEAAIERHTRRRDRGAAVSRIVP